MRSDIKFLRMKKIPMDLFSYYQGYFHDGSIEAITCLEDEIVFEMESAAIYTCDNRDLLPLSVDNTIYGRLHAKNIVSLKKNDKLVHSLKMDADCIDIFQLDLVDNRIFFVGDWVNYRPKVHADGMIKCEVIAKEIYWENTANTSDPGLLGKYLGLEGPPPYDYPQWYIDKYGPQDDDDDSDIEDGKD